MNNKKGWNRFNPENIYSHRFQPDCCSWLTEGSTTKATHQSILRKLHWPQTTHSKLTGSRPQKGIKRERIPRSLWLEKGWNQSSFRQLHPSWTELPIFTVSSSKKIPFPMMLSFRTLTIIIKGHLKMCPLPLLFLLLHIWIHLPGKNS